MAKNKRLGDLSNIEAQALANEISGNSNTGSVVTTIGKVIDVVNDELGIPENQRFVNWDSKKIKALEKEFIAFMLYTIIKMLSTSAEALNASVAEIFPEAKLILPGYYQKIAISYDRTTGTYGIQDGQHRFFHYLINFIKNGLKLNREDTIDNAEVARTIEKLFSKITNSSIGFEDLPEEWQNALLSIPVVINYVDTDDKTEASALFISENASDPVKTYDMNKSGNIGLPGWYRVNYVVESILSETPFELKINLQNKTKSYDKKKVQTLKSLLPKKCDTLTFFLQRNILLFNCRKDDYKWKNGQTHKDICSNYSKYIGDIAELDIDKMLKGILDLYLKVAKYYDNNEDMKKIRGLQSFTTGLAIIEKQYSAEYSNKEYYNAAMTCTINDMVHDLTGRAKTFNNAHYQKAKATAVKGIFEANYNSIVSASRRVVA